MSLFIHIHPFKAVIFKTTLFVLLALALPGPLLATANVLDGLSELPPGERYRQLSLLLLLADGADTEMLSFMSPVEQADPGSGAQQLQSLQQYPTPLARIADPESMLQGSAQMMRFAKDNREQIVAELEQIEQTWPILVSMIDMNSIREDAIIIRTAVADSLQYEATNPSSTFADFPLESLVAFREETLHQRNNMEYLLFKGELDEITDMAIDDLGYKLDAYQRMADQELDPELVQDRIDAADTMNAEARDRFREQAYIRASTLYLMLIPAMVTVITD